MFIKRLHPHIYDVFLGNGWDNWSRVKKTHYGATVILGRRLPHSVLKDIAKSIK